MTEEKWKDIEGFEGKYMVSNLGRIKALDYRRTGKEKILLQITDKLGYKSIQLWKNANRKKYKIHRLVANTFLPNPNNFPIINHKDKNPSNNSVENLEWCSYQYNVNYSKEEQLRGMKNSIKNKLKRKKVGQYYYDQLIKIYESIKSVEENGFTPASVSKCCTGKLKSHHGYQWRYID